MADQINDVNQYTLGYNAGISAVNEDVEDNIHHDISTYQIYAEKSFRGKVDDYYNGFMDGAEETLEQYKQTN